MKIEYREILICEILNEMAKDNEVRILDKQTELLYTQRNLKAEELSKIWATKDYNRYYCYVIETKTENE